MAKLSGLSFRTCDYVVTVSKWAEQELVKRYPLLENKIVSINHGISKYEIHGEDLSSTIKKKLPDSFFLLPGHLERYKRLEQVLLAVKLLRNQNYKCPTPVIYGKNRDSAYAEKLKKYSNDPLLNDVVFLGNIPRNSLFELYKRAQYFVFCSSVETCPITLMEAMTTGIPILCSSNGPMPEILGDTGTYFNIDDIEQIALRISELNEVPNKYNFAEKTIARSNNFRWDYAIESLEDVFKRVS